MSIPEYSLIRSDRSTISLEITPELVPLVRAPKRAPRSRIDSFVESHADWIAEHTEQARARAEKYPEPNPIERAALIDRARNKLPPLVARYANIMKLYPSRITITGAAKRFGSCSAQNSLCFSWRLMRYPDEAIEYVVVHELAHIAEKNHGPRFYAVVESALPDWRERRRLLNE